MTLAYCTGDQHMGNHVARYEDSNGSYMEVQHLGARNADSVLRWVQRRWGRRRRRRRPCVQNTKSKAHHLMSLVPYLGGTTWKAQFVIQGL